MRTHDANVDKEIIRGYATATTCVRRRDLCDDHGLFESSDCGNDQNDNDDGGGDDLREALHCADEDDDYDDDEDLWGALSDRVGVYRVDGCDNDDLCEAPDFGEDATTTTKTTCARRPVSTSTTTCASCLTATTPATTWAMRLGTVATALLAATTTTCAKRLTMTTTTGRTAATCARSPTAMATRTTTTCAVRLRAASLSLISLTWDSASLASLPPCPGNTPSQAGSTTLRRPTPQHHHNSRREYRHKRSQGVSPESRQCLKATSMGDGQMRADSA